MISKSNAYSYFLCLQKKYNTSFWNDSHFFIFKAKFLLKSLGQKVESFKRHIRREAEDRELARLIFMRKKKKSRIFRIDTTYKM